ncbi:MAG: RHS repeat-associated core domain-containing protein [Candidatus Acidiferrales bacterium]
MFATTGSPLPWQPTQVSCTSTATPAGNILDLKYNFNLGADNGNVLGIANNRDTTRSQNFAYDQVNRLVTAATTSTSGPNCWGQSYAYDQWANLTAVTATQCSAPMLSPTVNANNQITSGGMTYDLSGNVKYDGTYSYDWYADGRLDSISDKVTYIYDVFGNRSVKGGTGVTTQWYWYGLGSQALDESDGNGNVTDEYIYFGSQRVAHLGVSSGLTDFYVADHLGTSRTLLQSGQTSLCYDADFFPFGTEHAVTTTCTQTYKFTGKERDTESGLDNFGARYDSSQYGRFMTPDPLPWLGWQRGSSQDRERFSAFISNPQNFNLYAYADNNPLSRTDPTGRYTCDGTKAVR